MIKFFRHIRQRLIKENRVSRYLLYAIGEIVLVVIGILIALQINTWNENRKTEHLEIVLLKELQDNLRADIADMAINRDYHENAIRSTQIILTAFDSGIPPPDSLNRHYGKVSLIPKFLTTQTAYESFQKEGMRIIKNDSLRNAITHYYENGSKYMTEWNDAEWNVQFQDSRDVSRKFFKEFEVFKDLVPVNKSELAQSEEYKNYLNNRMGWTKVTIGLYERLAARAHGMIDLIEEEIRSRNGPSEQRTAPK